MQQKPTGKPFSILYAEDEHLTRGMVATKLSRRYPDIRIDTADNGATGLDLFMQSYHDLIIADNMMPYMSGIQMVSEIWAISPGTPVVIVAASLTQSGFQDVLIENDEVKEQSAIMTLTQNGCQDNSNIGTCHFLRKPFRFSELFNLIETYYLPSVLTMPWKKSLEALTIFSEY